MKNLLLILSLILYPFAFSLYASQCILLPLGQEKDGSYGPIIPPEILAQPFSASHPVDIKAQTVLVMFSDNVVIPAGYPIIPTTSCKAQLEKRFPGINTDFVDKVPTAAGLSVIKQSRAWLGKQLGKWFGPALAWAASATDNFNRADSADMGANWDNAYTGFTSCYIASNLVGLLGAGSSCLETYNAFIPGNNQYTQATIASLLDSTGDLGVSVRTAASPTDQMYLCRVKLTDGTRTSRIQLRNSGTNSNLTTDNAVTWSVTDIVKCEAVGSTLTIYRNGTLVSTAPDPGNLFPSGRGGVYILNSGATTTTTDFALDNFEVGDVSAAVVAPRHRSTWR